jgi:hypothetical protein
MHSETDDNAQLPANDMNLDTPDALLRSGAFRRFLFFLPE